MNKTELKKFAMYARNELRKLVQLRANTFGIIPEGAPTLYEGIDYVEIHNVRYPLSYRNALRTLVKEYERKGYDQLIEEVAYIWFNRIIALRYMELHDYLPSHVRVLSSLQPGKVDPDLLTEYRTVGLHVDKNEITDLLQQGKREEAYRKLLIAQCNELSEIIPFMFEKLNDYTELLLPDHLLATDSLINILVQNEDLTESFQEVEVVGWLYQFYISEKKDEVFEMQGQGIKTVKEDIPAATQLFTPAWIVKYMVENSLGHVWLETYPHSPFKSEMKYYIEPIEQEPEVQAKLDALRQDHISLEEIKLIDPACGSGHILVYAFDLLYTMYEEQGYPTRDIPRLILEKNLYGIDVDDRAVQLAGFALLMKARKKSRSILRKEIQLNIVSIQESNGMDTEAMTEFLYPENKAKARELKELLDTYQDAKNYGSLLRPKTIDFAAFYQKIEEVKEQGATTLFDVAQFEEVEQMKQLVKQTELLVNQYDVVVTNPPYMGSGNFDAKLKNWLVKNYEQANKDLYMAFIYRVRDLCKNNGKVAFVTQQGWMFNTLASITNFRKDFLLNNTITSLVHLGAGAFETISGEVVQPVVFTWINNNSLPYNSQFFGLDIYKGAKIKEEKFLERMNVFKNIRQSSFLFLPNSILAYWLSTEMAVLFERQPSLSSIMETREGLTTSLNDYFLKLWHEVSILNIGFEESRSTAMDSKKKWFPYAKEGEKRKWAGFPGWIVNWEDDGKEVRNFKKKGKKITSHNYNLDFIFKPFLTWSSVSVRDFSVRKVEKGYLFDTTSSAGFMQNRDIELYVLGLLNTKVIENILYALNPTLRIQPGNVGDIPFINMNNSNLKEVVYSLVEGCIDICGNDWNHFESSWGFKKHPFLTYRNAVNTVEESFFNWETHAETQFRQLQKNEEELNRIFIELYGLQDELIPEVPHEEVTVRRANRERDVKLFLSYFIGCAMGRYSLDADGLAYAGGEWDESKYQTFIPQKFGIISLNDESYFEDDIILRLQEFLKATFGEETVQENLYWLAESLTMKKDETAVERLRRYFIDEFYKDHTQMYQKRPIYWLVDSGKQKGLRALLYLHRYTKETLATLRFLYLQELQIKYTNDMKRLEDAMTNPSLSATEKKKLDKELTSLRKRQEELVEFDKLLADYANQQIDLDLDNGVVVNYAKFGKLLTALK